MHCKICNGKTEEVLDFGHQPLANSFLANLADPEIYYPLKMVICKECWTAQLEHFQPASKIFNDKYIYYSSQSPANLTHAKEYVDMITQKFAIKNVLEIGSNDGYMLQYFKEKGIQSLGVDPAIGCSMEATKKGITAITAFFSKALSKKLPQFDLICGINVLAHQPNLLDFVQGLKFCLAPNGVITFEFPYLFDLLSNVQFDTIYHEHYYYFSLFSLDSIFTKCGLTIFDVDHIPQHGGSLRIYAGHHQIQGAEFKELLAAELDKFVNRIELYKDFGLKSMIIRRNFLSAIEGKRVVAYGAAAKGNTFLNFCRPESVMCSVDRSIHKQHKYLPGSHLLVNDEASIRDLEPDLVLITAWNLKDEIMEQLKYIREWDGKFIIAIPKLEII